MNYKNLKIKKENGICIIMLHRPDNNNAISSDMRIELTEIVSEVAIDKSIKVVVFTGTGRVFCPGPDIEDLNAFMNDTTPNRWQYMQDIGGLVLAIRNIPKPVIAAVNGNAIGAGLSLALVCDIVIASDKARFGAPFVKVGLHPDNGATSLLVQRVGVCRAIELLLTSKIIDAEQAEQIGLVNQVAPADQLDEIVWKLATDLSKMPPLSVKMTKASIYQALKLDFAEVLELEARAQSILSTTEDFKEAMAAISEKRNPIFKGR